MTHYCDLRIKNTTIIGRDDYNRPQYGSDMTVENVRCRLEREITDTTDEQGENFILVVRMAFDKDVEINESVEVLAVRNKDGETIQDKVLEVDLFTPVYGRFGRLSHYEAQMKER